VPRVAGVDREGESNRLTAMTPISRVQQAFGLAMGWTLALRILGIPIQIAFFAFVARILPLTEFGWFAMSNAIWQACRGLGPLGFDQVALRFIPPLLMTGRETDATLLERSSRRRVVSVLGLVAGAMLLSSGVLWRLGQDTAGTWLALTAIAVPAFGLAGLQAAQLRARKRVRSAQWPESIGFYAIAAGGVGVAVGFGGGSLKAVLMAEALAAYALCAVCAALLRVRTAIGTTEGFGELRAQVSGTAREFFLGQLATALNGRIPTLLAGTLLGTAAAGLLEAAMRFGQLGGIVTWASGIAVSPMIAEAHARDDLPRLQRLLTLSTLATLGPSVILLATIAVAGQRLLQIFGPQFGAAYVPMVLIAAAAAVNASGGLSGTVFYMTARQRLVVIWSALGLATLLVVGLALGQFLGIVGIAVAILASSLVRDVGLSILISRLTPIAAPIWTIRGLRGCQAEIVDVVRFLRGRPHGNRNSI